VRHRFGAALVIAYATAVAAPAGAYGQVCDERLRPEPQSGFGYAIREPDVRCEGLYESSVRAPGLEVVSFLYERPRFDPAEHGSVQVIAPEVPELVAEPVRVRAVALPLKTYYRMDAVLPADGPLIWPVRDVLGPAGLAAEQIGVFGWSGSEIDKVFVPVRLRAADQRAPAASDPGAERAPSPQLLVRLANDAEKVLWRYKEAETTSDWMAAAQGEVAAGRTVGLSLPPGPATRLQIDVIAKRPDNDEWSSLRLEVVRPGA
jgi:hypothetical protein